MPTIRVFVVDDHPVVREGLAVIEGIENRGRKAGEIALPPRSRRDGGIERLRHRAAAGSLESEKEERLVFSVVDLRQPDRTAGGRARAM